MTIFAKIYQSFTPHVFSAMVNSIMIIILGALFMIDVIAYPGNNSSSCTILTPWSIVLTCCGLVLAIYALGAGNVLRCGRTNQSDEQNDEYQPPRGYMILLCIIAIINIVFSGFSVVGIDSCGGRLDLSLPYMFASWIIGPCLIISSFLLLVRRETLGPVKMATARYWVANIFLAAFSMFLWCFMCCSSDNRDGEDVEIHNLDQQPHRSSVDILQQPKQEQPPDDVESGY